MARAALLLVSVALAGGCVNAESGFTSGTLADDGGFCGCTPQVVIENNTYIPVELFVDPGDTIRFTNLDGDPHTVTSQAAPGLFELGEVNGISFDLASFTGTRTFQIPATAQHGTVVYYYDRVNPLAMMNQPRITIR